MTDNRDLAWIAVIESDGHVAVSIDAPPFAGKPLKDVLSDKLAAAAPGTVEWVADAGHPGRIILGAPIHLDGGGQPMRLGEIRIALWTGKRASAAAKWAEERITNAEVKAMIGSLGGVENKAEALRAAVAKAGLDRCAMLDHWEARP